MSDFNFKALADAALARAESLLGQWLPDGHKVGFEWKARNPVRDDRREGSFSINCVTGAWADFADSDAKGGDLVSLYAYLFCGGNQGEAAIALADILGLPDAIPEPESGKSSGKGHGKNFPPSGKSAAAKGSVVKEPREQKPGWKPVLPVPDDAPPPPKAHEFRGIPQSLWTYRGEDGRVLGYVGRFVTSDGGKEVLPLSFCRHDVTGKQDWRWISFPDPRPLYGLERLATKPNASVLVVEGEKCVDAAQAELPDLVVVSWPGGGNAVDKADWSPLAGRKVITWADCDSKREKLSKDDKAAGMLPDQKPFLPHEKQPGFKAMAIARGILHTLGCTLWDVEIQPPGVIADGWDVADFIAEGYAGEQVANHIRAQCVPWSPAEPKPTASAAGAGRAKPSAEGGDESWRDDLLWSKGELSDCLANVYDILANSPQWKGVLGYNEFSLRAVKLKPPPYANAVEGDWEGVDDSRTAIWLTRQWEITPSSIRVAEAVETLARSHSFHPVRDYLRSLPPHDGTLRLDHWLCDCLGVADSPYVRKVARWFLMGMVARVMEPGVKFDTCLVLEGSQGKGKSTALSILAGEFFDDTDLDLNNKDAMASLQGVWLHEFAELGSLAKAEASKQKSFLTRRVDKYRPVYGRRDIKAPRQTAFAGSVNDWEWQKDPTGGRRFWPAMCSGEFNLELLRENRDQLFAEALAAYLAKERFHPTPEEQKLLFDPEQLQREQPDSFIDALHDWVYSQVADFSVATAIMDGLGLGADKLTRDTQTRVGIALRKLGCTRVEKRNGMVRYWYKPPVRNGAASVDAATIAQPNPKIGGRDVPF